MRLFILSLFILTSISALSQTQTIEIISKKSTIELQHGGNSISFKELGEITKSNDAAYNFYKKAKSNNTAASIFAYTGGFLVGFPIGSALGGAEIDGSWYATLATGCALGLISLSFNKAVKKNLNLSVQEYNKYIEQKTKPQASLGITPSGLTLALKF